MNTLIILLIVLRESLRIGKSLKSLFGAYSNALEIAKAFAE